MAQTSYPYLDLTVLPQLRPLVISASAALLVDETANQVLWANGEGVQLIGTPNLRATLEGNAPIPAAMKRQFLSAIERLSNNQEASATLRYSRGNHSRLLGFSARRISLPKSEAAILLVTESMHGRGHTKLNMAMAAVGCLDGYSHASAILGPIGDVLAASKHFGPLEVPANELARLVDEISAEDDKLVKRLISTGSGELAAGVARLSDSPATHLLVIANADQTEESKISTSAESKQQSEDSGSGTAPKVGAFSNRRAVGGGDLARWYYRQPPSPVQDATTPATDGSRSDKLAMEAAREHVNIDDGLQGDGTERRGISPEMDQAPPQEDHAQSSELGVLVQETHHVGHEKITPEGDSGTVTDALDAAEQDTEHQDFSFSVAPKPVRFVWEMDASNEFQSVSENFAQTVGPNSGNIEGLIWQELCEAYDIENGSEITALLEKGDTWSGKTVLWPVEGTDLRVPIDLAGLPIYGRNRSFEGFNGFGIARTADAVVDPAALGMQISADSGAESPTDIGTVDTGEPADKPVDAELNQDKNSQQQAEEEQSGGRALSSHERETFEEIREKLTQGRHRHSELPQTPPAKSQPTPIETIHPSITGQSVSPEREKPVDTSILARLPIPVLVYRETELLFGNARFFEITGYSDLDALAEAGGIEALFGDGPDNKDTFRSQIFHANGKQLDVLAVLQRVPWDQSRAMLLTLRHEPRGNLSDDSGIATKPGQPVDVSTSAGEGTKGGPELGTGTSTVGSAETIDTVVPIRRELKEPEGDTRPAFGGLGVDDLRDILDTATDGVVILSDEGIVRAMNKSAEALFDTSVETIEGQSFTKLLAPESQRLAMDYLSGMSGTGVASLMNDGREVIGKTGQGGLLPLFMTIGKLQKTDACCAVMRDITHWKKAEEDLLGAKAAAENASAQKTEFLAKVSHEIRTPLNAIIGFSDMMIEERFGRIDNDRYRGYLRDINRSGRHVLELVNDLLDISKIEAGKLDLEFDACDLNTIVSETVALSQPDANKDRIIIRTSLSAVVPKVVADQRSLRQIILNLVTNSIKFTKSGGQVIVSTVYEESGEVVLRVRDTGVGMSELELARALKPFQQIKLETDAQGTGLGLPLTKAMVEANRARFEIQSQPEDGTLVEIYFPVPRVLADR